MTERGMLYYSTTSTPNGRLDLLKRVCAGVIDRIIVLFLYLFLLAVFLLYKIPYLGATCVIFAMKPHDYVFLDQDQLTYSFLFVLIYCIVNVLYFFISEALSDGSTIGYKLVFYTNKIRLVSIRNERKISTNLLLGRQLIFLCIVLSTWLFSYMFNVPYVFAVLFNILIIHLPALGPSGQSVLDYCTGVMYVLTERKAKVPIIPSSLPRNNKLNNDKLKLRTQVMKLGKIFANKRCFPFNIGVNRLLFVLWIAISLAIEVSNWEIRSYGISNYFVGLIPLFMGPIVYFAIVWVYNGFKIKK